MVREEGSVGELHPLRSLLQPCRNVGVEIREDVLHLALELMVARLRAERAEDDESQRDERLEQRARIVAILTQQPVGLLAVQQLLGAPDVSTQPKLGVEALTLALGAHAQQPEAAQEQGERERRHRGEESEDSGADEL
jgi:hypothetical protein